MTANKELAERLREASYLLSQCGPERCPEWREGLGDCGLPGCAFCRIQRCIDSLDEDALAFDSDRQLLATDSWCPACGHNRDKSAISTIDLDNGHKRCQVCGAMWREAATALEQNSADQDGNSNLIDSTRKVRSNVTPEVLSGALPRAQGTDTTLGSADPLCPRCGLELDGEIAEAWRAHNDPSAERALGNADEMPNEPVSSSLAPAAGIAIRPVHAEPTSTPDDGGPIDPNAYRTASEASEARSVTKQIFDKIKHMAPGASRNLHYQGRLIAAIHKLERECADLRHDIERYVGHNAELATENADLRKQLNEAQRYKVAWNDQLAAERAKVVDLAMRFVSMEHERNQERAARETVETLLVRRDKGGRSMSDQTCMTVTEIKELSSGYVRVSAGHNAWAQMPKHVWDALKSGELVPLEYTFEPRWNRVRKA